MQVSVADEPCVNVEVLHAPPQLQEILSGPDGTEKERRDPQDVPGNVNEVDPVRWTGKKVPKKMAVRKFAFKRTLQIRHVDGLTYDFLHKMAKELSDEVREGVKNDIIKLTSSSQNKGKHNMCTNVQNVDVGPW